MLLGTKIFHGERGRRAGLYVGLQGCLVFMRWSRGYSTSQWKRRGNFFFYFIFDGHGVVRWKRGGIEVEMRNIYVPTKKNREGMGGAVMFVCLLFFFLN